MNFTIIDIFRRRPRKETRTICAQKPAPWGETIRSNSIPGIPSPPTGIVMPVKIRARGCECDKGNWYTCPKRTDEWLYYRCGLCGVRWNPWPPGHRLYLKAARVIGQENALDHMNEQFDERTRIDPEAIGYGDNDG